MECLEGETLADRLQKGALPVEQALKIGIEVCQALDKAHRQGIVHRDLKPGNIMLTKSGVKLLDFGLAKAIDSAAASGLTLSLTSPPPNKPVTAAGTVIGTFQYMAPEQIEGKEADARTDIFALGAVLYEMATGKRAFNGKSQASIVAAILASEPQPISMVQPMSPPALDRVVKICLAKDPDERWQTAHDVKLQLQWIAEAGSQAGVPSPVISHRKRRERLAWAAMSIFFVSTIALAIGFALRAPKITPPIRFFVLPPENSYINAEGRIAVSPDGRHLAFVASDSNGKNLLWVRSFDSLTSRSLAGTEGAELPFWSPDSRWIGFFANDTLQKIDITGAPPISVASVIASNGGTWSRDGVILFGTGATRALYRVSAAGGEVAPLMKRETTTGYGAPYFFPDGNHYLYEGTQTKTGHGIYLSSLDSDTSRLLVRGGTRPVYQQGRLLYLLGTTLISQPLDEKRLEIVGDASALAEEAQFFSASQTGAVLAYWTGSAENLPQLIWFDRSGNRIGKLGDPVSQFNIRLSPDSTRVAAEIRDPQVGVTNSDIWLYDVVRGVRSRFTSGPGSARVPCWSPDGKKIVFSSDRKGHFDLYEKATDGTGDERPLLESQDAKYCENWSPDGKFILYTTFLTNTSHHLWTLPLFADRTALPYLPAESVARGSRFSPDGKWIVYASAETGKSEVYVRPFPGPGGKLLVSGSGGKMPVWSQDGKEIFYLGPNRELMAARVNQNGSSVEISNAGPLFQTHADSFLANFDVSADGRRFLIVTSTPQAQKSSSPITVVVNWTATLKQ